MSKRFVLDRRTVLRGMLAGASVAVGLPTLEAMFATDRAAYAAEYSVKQTASLLAHVVHRRKFGTFILFAHRQYPAACRSEVLAT